MTMLEKQGTKSVLTNRSSHIWVVEKLCFSCILYKKVNKFLPIARNRTIFRIQNSNEALVSYVMWEPTFKITKKKIFRFDERVVKFPFIINNYPIKNCVSGISLVF